MSPKPRPPLAAAFFLSVITLAVAPIAALGDLGARVPSEATPEELAALTAALRKAQTAPVRVFAARTPSAEPPAEPAPPAAATAALEQARKAYKSLEMDTARTFLAEAESACLADGRCDACRDLLFDAHLLAGAIAASLGQEDLAASEFITAHAAHPPRVVDPRRFPPKIVGAFNRACADMEKLPPSEIRVASEPKGAALRLDGETIPADTGVQVKARRVYVDAQLAGFAPRCEALDSAAGPAPSHAIRLSEIPADRVPAEAALLLSAPGPALDAATVAFLGRIGVDRFVSLAIAAKPLRFTARAARAGAPAWVELPPLASAADAGAPRFAEALAAAVGDAPVAETPPVLPPANPPDDDPDGLEDEEEDDSVMLDPDVDSSPGGGASSGSKILRSPWLWISIGVVVAVVGGVVIGTQVND
jgi:hypothetical protein